MLLVEIYNRKIKKYTNKKKHKDRYTRVQIYKGIGIKDIDKTNNLSKNIVVPNKVENPSLGIIDVDKVNNLSKGIANIEKIENLGIIDTIDVNKANNQVWQAQ